MGRRIQEALLLLCITTLCCIHGVGGSCADYDTDDCDGCLADAGCAFCTSNVASGCFNASFSNYCGLIGGQLGNCAASGTPCADLLNCTACTQDDSCGWCSMSDEEGYCFASNGAFICNPLGGIFNPPMCEHPETVTAVTDTPATSTGPVVPGLYAQVDPNAQCGRFDGQHCTGFVFYNVFLNETYTQQDMSDDMSFYANLAYLPGVSQQCRNVAFQLTCGDFFQDCVNIPGTDVVASVPPCKDLCLRSNNLCGNVLEPIGELLDCDQIDGRTGLEKYPSTSITYMYQGTLYEFPCNDMIPSTDNAGYYPNVLSNAGFDVLANNGDLNDWSRMGEGDYVIVQNETVFSSVSQVVQMESVAGTTQQGIIQKVSMKNLSILPVRISGLSKAVDVDGERNDNYALCVEMQYAQSTESEVQCAPFNTGSHDFQLEQFEFTPVNPIENITFFVLFHGHNGTASFESVAFQEKIPDKSDQVTCLWPLIENLDMEEGEEVCVYACPSFWIWDDQAVFESALTMHTVVSWMSFLLTSFLLATWIIRRERWGYPDRLLYYFTACFWLLALRGVSMSFYKGDDKFCKSPSTFLNQSNSGACLIFGMWQQFAAAASMGWWLATVFSSWLVIKTHMKQDTHQYLEKYFHIGSWGFAGFSAILPALYGKYTVGLGSTLGCYLPGGWWQWSMFYIPLAVTVSIGLPFGFHTMYMIYKMTRMSRHSGDGKSSRLWGTYIRLSVFLGIIFINFVYLGTWRLITYLQEDGYYAEVEQQSLCLARGGNEEECQVGGVISAWSVWFNDFLVQSEGTLLFVFFGLSKKNWNFWLRTISGNRLGAVSATLPVSGSKKSHNKSVSNDLEMQIASGGDSSEVQKNTTERQEEESTEAESSGDDEAPTPAIEPTSHSPSGPGSPNTSEDDEKDKEQTHSSSSD